MTVGELRKALEGVPDELPIYLEYDGAAVSLQSAILTRFKEWTGRGAFASALQDDEGTIRGMYLM